MLSHLSRFLCCLGLLLLPAAAKTGLEAVSISSEGGVRAEASAVRRLAAVRTSPEKGDVLEEVASESEFWPWLDARHSTPASATIPSHLHFNWRVNLLEIEQDLTRSLRENVKAIINLHPGAKVYFHNDKQCEALIARVHSNQLADFFAIEPQGCFKSDICRLAVLYEFGGYYFDNDFNPLVDVRKLVPPNASMSSVLSMTDRAKPARGMDSRYDLFQAFLAASPKHPVIMHAMNSTLKWYESGHARDVHQGRRQMFWTHPARNGPCNQISEECHQVLPGPVFLGKAVRQWLAVKELHAGQMDRGSCNAGEKCVYLFQETDDLTSLGLDERKPETGFPRCSREPFHAWCNIAVADSDQRPMGWSRSPEAAEFEGFSFPDSIRNGIIQRSIARRARKSAKAAKRNAKTDINAHLMTYDPGVNVPNLALHNTGW